jgi:RNA-binding protein
LKRLGEIFYIVDNMLIARTDKTLEQSALRENSAVFTKKMKKIGKVKELFGPVKSPYVSIKAVKGITISELTNLKNERVYLQ